MKTPRKPKEAKDLIGDDIYPEMPEMPEMPDMPVKPVKPEMPDMPERPEDLRKPKDVESS